MNGMRLSSVAYGLLVSLVGVFLLTGCVSRQETAIIQAGPGGVAQAARPAGPLILNKTALVGQTITVYGLTSVNPDCTPGTLATIRITQQPMHGTAQVVHGESYSSFPAANPRSSCNKTKTPSVEVKYTPATDFTGSDLMAIEAFTSSGADSNEIKVLITIK